MIFICIQTFVIINLIEYWDLQSRLLLVLMEISFSISLTESPYNIIKDSENYFDLFVLVLLDLIITNGVRQKIILTGGKLNQN